VPGTVVSPVTSPWLARDGPPGRVERGCRAPSSRALPRRDPLV